MASALVVNFAFTRAGYSRYLPRYKSPLILEIKKERLDFVTK